MWWIRRGIGYYIWINFNQFVDVWPFLASHFTKCTFSKPNESKMYFLSETCSDEKKRQTCALIFWCQNWNYQIAMRAFHLNSHPYWWPRLDAEAISQVIDWLIVQNEKTSSPTFPPHPEGYLKSPIGLKGLKTCQYSVQTWPTLLRIRHYL